MRSSEFWEKQTKVKGVDIKMPPPSSGVLYREELEPEGERNSERRVFGSVPRFLLTKFGNIAQHLTSPRGKYMRSKEKSKTTTPFPSGTAYTGTPFPSGTARINVTDDEEDNYVYFIPVSRTDTVSMTTDGAGNNVPSTSNVESYENRENTTTMDGESSHHLQEDNIEVLHPSGANAKDSSSSFNIESSFSSTTLSTTLTLPSQSAIEQELIYHPTISSHQVDNLTSQRDPSHSRDAGSSSISINDAETFQYSTSCTSDTSIAMKCYRVVGRDFNETHIGKNRDKKKPSDSCPLEFPSHMINIGKSDHRVSGCSSQNVSNDQPSSEKKSILVRIGKREQTETTDQESFMLRDSSSSTIKIRTVYADYDDPDYETWNSNPNSSQHGDVLLVPVNECELEVKNFAEDSEEDGSFVENPDQETFQDSETHESSDRELGDEEIIANVRKMFKPPSPAGLDTETVEKHAGLKPATGTCNEKVSPIRDIQENSMFEEVWEIAEACKTQISNLLELKKRSYSINTEVSIQPTPEHSPTNENLINYHDRLDQIVKSPGKKEAGIGFQGCSYSKAPLLLDHPKSGGMNHVCCNTSNYSTHDLIKDLNKEMASIKKMMQLKQRPCHIKPRRNTEDSSENSTVLMSGLCGLQQTLGEFAKVVESTSSSRNKITEKKNEEDIWKKFSFNDSLSDLYKVRQWAIKPSNDGQEQNDISRLKLGQSSYCNKNRVSKDRLKKCSSISNMNLVKKQGISRKIPKLGGHINPFTLGRTGDNRPFKARTSQNNEYSDRYDSYQSTFSHPSIAKLTEMSNGFTHLCSADETSSDSDVSFFARNADAVTIDSDYDSRLENRRKKGNMPLPSGSTDNSKQNRMVVIGSRGRRGVNMPPESKKFTNSRKINFDKGTQTKNICASSDSPDSSSSNSSTTFANKRNRRKMKIYHSNRKSKNKLKGGVEQNNKELLGKRNKRIQAIPDHEENIDENERLRLLHRKYELSDSVSSFCSNYTTPGERSSPLDENQEEYSRDEVSKSSLTVISNFSSEEQNTVKKSASRTHGELTPNTAWKKLNDIPEDRKSQDNDVDSELVSSSDTNISG